MRALEEWTFTAYAAHASLLGLLSHGELILSGVMRASHGRARGWFGVEPAGEGGVCERGREPGETIYVGRDEGRRRVSITTRPDPWVWDGWWEARKW